jgi:L-asparaginase
MQTVYLITTGGTIEKEYSEQLGVVHNNESKIAQYLRQLRLPGSDVRIVQLMNKDSLEMTSGERASLVAKVTELLSSECPVIITHGTDTMVASGILIKKSIQPLRVPVVLTGAMTPLGFERSDGLQNLTESLMAVRLLSSGVYVVMHGQVFPVTHTRKDPKSGTFVPIESSPE